MRFNGALPTLSYLSLSHMESLITNIRTQLLVMTHPQFPFLRLASLPFYQLLMLLCTIHQQCWQIHMGGKSKEEVFEMLVQRWIQL